MLDQGTRARRDTFPHGSCDLCALSAYCRSADGRRKPHLPEALPLYWEEGERAEFAAHIASNPEEGVLIRGSGGVRKVRWSRSGTGKSGGVRVVYLLRTEREEVYLLTLFAKSETENIPLAVLKEIRRALEV